MIGVVATYWIVCAIVTFAILLAPDATGARVKPITPRVILEAWCVSVFMGGLFVPVAMLCKLLERTDRR